MVYLNKGYCENADFFYNSYMTNLNKFFTAYLGIIQNVISDKKGTHQLVLNVCSFEKFHYFINSSN